MQRSTHRILTTHAGSLIRSPEIIEVMIAREAGEAINEADYADILSNSVAEVVHRQAQIGLDVISDGEYGKTGWIPYIGERLTGFEPDEVSQEESEQIWPEQERFGDFYREYGSYESTMWLPDVPSRASYKGSYSSLSFRCTGPIEYRPEALRRDIHNFEAALHDVEIEGAFLPVVAPCSVEVFPNEYYKTEEEYLFALADALRSEYQTIVDAGFVVQIDDAFLPVQRWLGMGDKSIEEYYAWAELRVEALNHALKGIPREMVRYHICWGSQNIPHITDIALSDLVELVLKVNAGAFSIESANPRHEHEWQVWQDVKLPDGAILIPGVISHCTNVVEHPELIALRLTTFAGLVGRENVIAGTDCGFSQYWNLVRVHTQIQWAKLEALVEGARLASEMLWGKAA